MIPVGIAIVPKHEETISGDAAGHWHDGGRSLLCVADGLGHGPLAAQAAQAAIATVAALRTEPLEQIIAVCDQRLRQTRGAALGLAVIDRAAGSLEYVGVGNIRAIHIGIPQRRFVNSTGIVGAGYNQLFIDRQPLQSGGLLLMYSDGIAEIMDPRALLDDRDDLQRMAERLIAELASGRDDACVLICRTL